MSWSRNHITVFEHQAIKLGQIIDGQEFDKNKLLALEKYYGTEGVPYYSLINNGVRFNEYVGVIQIANTTIEVLPKADNTFDNCGEKKHWRDILIDMLLSVGIFDIESPSISSLKLKANSILDLYFQLFIKEVEYLLHKGLVKKYRRIEENSSSLRGGLNFSKHVQKNLVHQERFYVNHSTYDIHHELHFILFKTICLLKQINTNGELHSRIGAILLHFPEMPDIKVTHKTFEKLTFTRKTEAYKRAINIAKLLLLQYHPDVSKGKNDVLALMFDMNVLWEKFVYMSLRRCKNFKVTAQTSKPFWKAKFGYWSKIRPDIVINKDDENNCVVLDTKWKNLNGYNPSPDDLRQLFVYHEYYRAKRVALVYPGTNEQPLKGKYLHPSNGFETDKECSVISFSPKANIKEWQNGILYKINEWMK